jgi:hypothetical protein
MAAWTAQSTRLNLGLGDCILLSVRFKALVFSGARLITASRHSPTNRIGPPGRLCWRALQVMACT